MQIEFGHMHRFFLSCTVHSLTGYQLRMVCELSEKYLHFSVSLIASQFLHKSWKFLYCFTCVQSTRQAKRLSGFKGYYKIWRKLMVDDNNKESDD